MVKEDNTFENNLIRIGENAEDNDQIIKESNQTDIWFPDKKIDPMPLFYIHNLN